MTVATEPLAFIASLSDAGAGLRLPITGSSFTIGRDPLSSLCIADDTVVSRHHCVIHRMGSSLMIEDTSRNGTFLDGVRVAGISPLPTPSTIMIGHTRLAVMPSDSDEGHATSAMESPYADQSALSEFATAALKIRTDAFLVVDLVDSTGLIAVDEPHFAKLVLVMGRRLEQELQGAPEPFLKCTGDGFLACFPSASEALRAAVSLGPAIAGQIPVEVQLSVALHWGVSHLTEQGDRIGNNVHAVFALEKVRHEVPAIEQELGAKKTPTLILMTEAFYSELDESERATAQAIGEFSLKGFQQDVSVYRWTRPADQAATDPL